MVLTFLYAVFQGGLFGIHIGIWYYKNAMRWINLEVRNYFFFIFSFLL